MRPKWPVSKKEVKAPAPGDYNNVFGAGKNATQIGGRRDTGFSFAGKPRERKVQDKHPDPGSYNPYKPERPGAKACSFGTGIEAEMLKTKAAEERAAKKAAGPGPDKFAPIDLGKVREKQKVYSFTSRPREPKDQQRPGPGKYNAVPLAKLTRTQPAPVISGRWKDPKGKDDGPGPCAYDPYKKDPLKGPAWSMSGRPKVHKRQ